MLYMPAAADLLKPTDKNTKESKREKPVRRWQHDVRKAKTYNGRFMSLARLQSVFIRGAVWVLSVIKTSDLTLLSRILRKTMRNLVLGSPRGRARST
jgi:hypothetical protein